MSEHLTSQQKHDQHEDARIAVATLARQEARAREQSRIALLGPFVETPHAFATPIVSTRDHTVVVGQMDRPWQRITDEYDGTCTA